MWQTIPDFTKYEISTRGKVRHRKLLHILKYSKPSNGYLQVNIYSDVAKYPISKCVHQLMALTFMGEKPLKHEVAHKDDNRENNKLSNLEYLYWRKNRTKKTRTMNCCLFCGTKTYNKYYCSKQCRWFGTRVLVTCKGCGKQFYRTKSQLRAKTSEREYIRGRAYCSYQCFILDKRISPELKKERRHAYYKSRYKPQKKVFQ